MGQTSGWELVNTEHFCKHFLWGMAVFRSHHASHLLETDLQEMSLQTCYTSTKPSAVLSNCTHLTRSCEQWFDAMTSCVAYHQTRISWSLKTSLLQAYVPCYKRKMPNFFIVTLTSCHWTGLLPGFSPLHCKLIWRQLCSRLGLLQMVTMSDFMPKHSYIDSTDQLWEWCMRQTRSWRISEEFMPSID